MVSPPGIADTANLLLKTETLCDNSLPVILGCLSTVGSQAQQTSPTPIPTTPSEFIVLRTERVTVSTGESAQLNCSVIGGTGAVSLVEL